MGAGRRLLNINGNFGGKAPDLGALEIGQPPPIYGQRQILEKVRNASMLLEARAANCFSAKFVLKVDGRPFGVFHGRRFSESLDIGLTERRHLQFRKVGWLGSQFELIDTTFKQLHGSCSRSGFFTSSWDLNLSVGPGRLERADWFSAAYEFKQGAWVQARVNRLGWCERGWLVDGEDSMRQEDLLLIGLVYQVILRRHAAHQNPSN